MLQTRAYEQIRSISSFLDECGFHCASGQVGAEDVTQIFPPFLGLQEYLKRCSNLHRFLFAVFRQGHPTSAEYMWAHLPREIVTALIETGVLVQNDWGEYTTPSLAIASVHGLKLVVSLPPEYPTATARRQPIYIGPDTLLVASCLPATLRGKRVLEVCGSSGLQGLLCAARGASRVVSLSRSAQEANAIRFNAILNGLHETVEVRESDLYTGLGEHERFDFVVCGQFFFPMAGATELSPDGPRESEGSAVLRSLFEGLCAHMAPAFSGVLGCQALGDNHSIFINRDLKQIALRDGFHAGAVVSQKQTLNEYQISRLAPTLRGICAEWPEARRTALSKGWSEEVRQRGASHVYSQVLRLQRPSPKAGVSHVPLYPALSTDPLVSLVRRHRATA
jgi:hypothetical protein